MSLKQIKSKIRGVGKTMQVTKAMEAVSAAKMRKSQEKAFSVRPYSVAAFKMLKRIKSSLRENHPFLTERDSGKYLAIVIVSDRGLAGSLNNGVLRKVSAFFSSGQIERSDCEIISIGKKATEYFSKRGYAIVHHADAKTDYPDLNEVNGIVDKVAELYRGGLYKEVFVAYPNFISTFEQEPVLHRVFPISENEVEKIISDIVPAKGKYSEMFKETGVLNGENSVYTCEPDEKAVLDFLLPYLGKVILYHALLETKASEFSARMVAMKNAGDKALEISKELKSKFNKARQGAITREVSEITSGIESVKA